MCMINFFMIHTTSMKYIASFVYCIIRKKTCDTLRHCIVNNFFISTQDEKYYIDCPKALNDSIKKINVEIQQKVFVIPQKHVLNC